MGSGKVEKFEDLDAFRVGRKLCAQVFDVTSDGPLARNFRLVAQMQAAAVSIISNIAEGFERGRLTEFHQFLSISKRSCGELRAQLYACLDAGLISQQHYDETRALLDDTYRLVRALRASVERKRDSQLGNRPSQVREDPAEYLRESDDLDTTLLDVQEPGRSTLEHPSTPVPQYSSTASEAR
jgi:four helix bundle protein